MSTSSAWQRIQTYFNLINHCIISIVAVYMTFFAYRMGSQLISWHVWLCATGYQLLMAQAILSLFPENVWTKIENRQVNKTIHGILQGLGAALAIAGMIIEFANKVQNSRSHFQSTHARLGLAAFIFTLISLLNGLATFYSVKLKGFVKPKFSKLGHNIAGITAFVLGMVTLYFGYDQFPMVLYSREDTRKWLQAACIITILLTLFSALRSTIRNARAVFN